jgi:hypothetical protein
MIGALNAQITLLDAEIGSGDIWRHTVAHDREQTNRKAAGQRGSC